MTTWKRRAGQRLWPGRDLSRSGWKSAIASHFVSSPRPLPSTPSNSPTWVTRIPELAYRNSHCHAQLSLERFHHVDFGLAFEFTKNLLRFRKPPFPLLREDQLVVDEDIEDPPSALDERGVHTGLFLDGGRQTGGPGEVVSPPAIRDFDFHFDLQSRNVLDLARLPNSE